MKAIFVLLDSLNRNYLPIYGNDWVRAPNICRLTQRPFAELESIRHNHRTEAPRSVRANAG